MNRKKIDRKVVVGMSGGVDSSVTAALLKTQGYDVTGVFLRFWKEKRKRNEEALQDARKVCKLLGIPLKVIDARKKFKKEVVDCFLKEYASGNTPNPCVICNEKVKFRVLFDLMAKLKAGYMATGHYALVRKFKVKAKTIYKLFQASDKKKDQSYFLYRLGQKQLAKIIFPLGEHLKSQVRTMAKKFNLPVYDKSESQNICFLSDDGINRFLRSRVKMKSGDIVSREGIKLGKHRGLPLYTLGQRKGIAIGGSGPYYVQSKNKKKNELIVTNNSNDPAIFSKLAEIQEVYWTALEPKLPGKFLVRTRYRQKLSYAIISKKKAAYVYEIVFSQAQRAVTPGQSAVFYRENGEVIGGGIIKK